MLFLFWQLNDHVFGKKTFIWFTVLVLRGHLSILSVSFPYGFECGIVLVLDQCFPFYFEALMEHKYCWKACFVDTSSHFKVSQTKMTSMSSVTANKTKVIGIEPRLPWIIIRSLLLSWNELYLPPFITRITQTKVSIEALRNWHFSNDG